MHDVMVGATECGHSLPDELADQMIALTDSGIDREAAFANTYFAGTERRIDIQSTARSPMLSMGQTGQPIALIG
jgi:hypothetical protein